MGFGVWDSVFGSGVQRLGSRVEDLGLKIHGVWCMVQGSGSQSPFEFVEVGMLLFDCRSRPSGFGAWGFESRV